MIFVDASALAAIILREPEADWFIDALSRGERAVTSPLAVFEAALAVRRRFESTVREAVADVDELVSDLAIEIVPIERSQGHSALEAFDRFGKGRHPAALNMGDCFAYALAKAHGSALLFKGDDFVKTDIAVAVELP
jgi:ribonuclease VapC